MKNDVMNWLGVVTVCVAASACSPASSSSPLAPTSELGAPIGLESGAVASRPDHAGGAKPGQMTIVGIVVQDDGEFDVLQAAVIRAGLVEALNGNGQKTVFAPTDQAFVATLGVVDEAAALAVVNSLAIERLTDILLYHVTNGRRNSNSVLAAPSYQMLNGRTLTRPELQAAGLAATDVSASNGIVHVINRVLIP